MNSLIKNPIFQKILVSKNIFIENLDKNSTIASKKHWKQNTKPNYGDFIHKKLEGIPISNNQLTYSNYI